ncbi:hypothetical protein NDU88_010321 [Pleurodeles waltl]|uniref:Uncharacterized protein n=1 Tax=Pleurodeles waltl TaxID=8319 RepID=A0AAV7S126_PLEWA|nr:hypothetical protein NDU88_010321 [Pleurodeles waltl]
MPPGERWRTRAGPAGPPENWRDPGGIWTVPDCGDGEGKAPPRRTGVPFRGILKKFLERGDRAVSGPVGKRRLTSVPALDLIGLLGPHGLMVEPARLEEEVGASR